MDRATRNWIGNDDDCTMKRLALFTFALLLCTAAPAQIVISGTVRYADGSGLASGVGVMLMSLDGKSMLGFQNAAQDGRFSLNYRGAADSLLLRCNALDIKPLERRLAARTQTLSLVVESAPLSITEARVKEPPMRQRGDTLVYTVAQYLDSTDRAIGDVLRKMPGITVEKSGRISYNGKEINRFYIEGMDMLGRGYGVATNNIKAADIASVEVYERHQPIRALESLERPDQAALNLKLKESARGTWTATLQAGGGYKPILWNAEAVAMFFGRKVQTMLTYKGNNEGNDIVTQEVLSFDTPPIESAASLLHLQTPAEPPVDRSRYLMNNVHAVSGSVLSRLRPTLDLTAKASYIHDRQTAEGTTLTRYYFLQEQPVEITELIDSQLKTDQAEVSLRLVNNNATHYLDERLNLTGKMYDATGTAGSIGQQLHRPAFSVENRFSDLIRKGERVWSVSSNTSYVEGEAALSVSPLPFSDLATEATPNAVQQLHTRRFDTQNYLRWSQNIGWWQLMMRTYFNARVENLQSSFSLAEADFQHLTTIDSMTNDVSLRRFDLILAPRLEYNMGEPFKIAIDLPLDARFTSYYAENERHFHFIPRITLSGDIAGGLRYIVDARRTVGVGGVNSLYTGWMMTDYRSIGRRSGQLSHSVGYSASAGLEYKNPWIGMVASLRGTLSRTEQDLLVGSVIEGMLVRQESLPIAHHSDRYGLELAYSQRINALATTLGLALNRTLQDAQILRQEQLIPSRRSLWQARLSATTRISDKAQIFYRGSGSIVTSRIDGGDDLSRFAYLQQSLTGQFLLGKNVRLDTSIEHYFNDAVQGSHRHFIFADLGLGWIIHRTELRLEARNLFNHRTFNYATTNNLIDTETISPLRPASVEIKIRFSIL